ncbi:MAG: hypothetical protein HYU39_08080 [Thaumarchaeota archaeon]|nr:hypothetical protein [Nitrososphaerota archaeon]
MQIKELQDMQDRFVKERGWDKFPASLVFTHLIEEMGEIGRHILFEEGYKVSCLGHEKHNGLQREFAQALSLFLQIANHFNIDLEDAVLAEAKIMEKRFNSEQWRRYMNKYGNSGPIKTRKTSK